MFAMMLLNGLKQAGAERKVWPTQFALRTGHGTKLACFLFVNDEGSTSKLHKQNFLSICVSVVSSDDSFVTRCEGSVNRAGLRTICPTASCE